MLHIVLFFWYLTKDMGMPNRNSRISCDTLDNSPRSMLTAKRTQSPASHPATPALDNKPQLVLAKPDLALMNTTRRWLCGAARLLADASNGDPAVERLACDICNMAQVTAIVIDERTPKG